MTKQEAQSETYFAYSVPFFFPIKILSYLPPGEESPGIPIDITIDEFIELQPYPQQELVQ